MEFTVQNNIVEVHYVGSKLQMQLAMCFYVVLQQRLRLSKDFSAYSNFHKERLREAKPGLYSTFEKFKGHYPN